MTADHVTADRTGADRGRPPAATDGGGSDPTFHQLRLFLLLAEELHFGRASARAFVSQPAFSRQIRSLERRLGAELALRDSRSVRLTAAGLALVPLARTAMETAGRIRALAGTGGRLRLRLGAIGGEAAMPYTRAILDHLSTHYPELDVQMRSVDFVEQLQALAQGELDAVFVRPPMPPFLESIELAVEPRVVCLPAADRLAARASVRLGDLAGHTVVDVPPEVPREWWDHWTVNPRPDGSRVRFGAVTRDLEAMLLAVARGDGITFLPAAARLLYPRPGIVYVDVPDLPPTTAAMAWLPANRGTPALLAARRAARAVVAALAPADRMASTPAGRTPAARTAEQPKDSSGR